MITKLKKWLQRDRYGIIRGGIGLALVIVMVVALFVQVLIGYDASIERERASNAVSFVAARFAELVDNGFLQMEGTIELIRDGAASEDVLLSALLKSVPFGDVGVVQDGDVTHADGSVTKDVGSAAYLRYDALGAAGKLIAQEDGALQLRVAMDDARDLVAWFSPEAVNAVLSCAFEGAYGYAVYNAATGAYLFNRTAFGDGGYYDALLDINRQGSTEVLLNSNAGQARIKTGPAGEDCYIAQQQTAIHPLSIALIIPEALVKSDSPATWAMPSAAIVSAFLLLLMLSGYMTFALVRIRRANQKAERALKVHERMMNAAAMEARATLFAYRRGQSGPLPCYDGLRLIGGAEEGTRSTTLNALLGACRLEDEGLDRLQERMRELKPGENMEMTLRSSASGREEHMLRFTMSMARDDAEYITVSIQDCTLQMISQARAEEERRYRVSMEPKAASIWQINASRNLWRAVSVRRRGFLSDMGVAEDSWRDYTRDQESVLRDYIHPDDYEKLFQRMSLSGILSVYRSGEPQIVRDYRVRGTSEAQYQWHRMKVRVNLSPDTGEVLANVYVFNIDGEKNAELERDARRQILTQTLTALGGVFYGLYYVDLEKDLCYTAKDRGGELVSRFCTPFKATFDAYIDSVVHEDDREGLRALLSVYNLRRSMTEGSHFQRREYRRQAGEDYEWASVIVQPARFENGTVREVAVALSMIERGENG